MSAHIAVARVYDDDSGGYRVLVDRLWPRGLSKQHADLAEWCKDVAPSTTLRRWYGHDPSRFAEFRRRYVAELQQEPAAAAVEWLAQLAGRSPVVLLTATRDVERSAARVLADVLTSG